MDENNKFDVVGTLKKDLYNNDRIIVTRLI